MKIEGRERLLREGEKRRNKILLEQRNGREK